MKIIRVENSKKGKPEADNNISGNYREMDEVCTTKERDSEC